MGDLSRINSSVGDSESVEFKNMELVDLYYQMVQGSAKLQFSGFVNFVHALANYFYLYTPLHPVGLKISWDLRLFTSVCLLLKLSSRNSR